MVDIKKGIKTKTITLPDYPDSKVILSNDSERFVKLFNADLGDDKILLAILAVVKEWNMEESGKPLEISVENIKKLPYSSLTVLIGECNKFLDLEKKV